MHDYLDRLRHYIDQSEFALNLSKLSVASGMRHGYVSDILRNNRKPNFAAIARICANLGVTPNDLLGLPTGIGISFSATSKESFDQIADKIVVCATELAKNKMRDRPSTDGMLGWWHDNGGRLEGHGQISPFFDLYEEPRRDLDTIVLSRMGERSTAAQCLGSTDSAILKSAIAMFDAPTKARIIKAHRSALSGQPLLSVEAIDVSHPSGDVAIAFSYSRLLLPVTDRDGKLLVLTYCQMLN